MFSHPTLKKLSTPLSNCSFWVVPLSPPSWNGEMPVWKEVLYSPPNGPIFLIFCNRAHIYPSCSYLLGGKEQSNHKTFSIGFVEGLVCGTMASALMVWECSPPLLDRKGWFLYGKKLLPCLPPYLAAGLLRKKIVTFAPVSWLNDFPSPCVVWWSRLL